jgi:hypothetical protein
MQLGLPLLLPCINPPTTPPSQRTDLKPLVTAIKPCAPLTPEPDLRRSFQPDETLACRFVPLRRIRPYLALAVHSQRHSQTAALDVDGLD